MCVCTRVYCLDVVHKRKACMTFDSIKCVKQDIATSQLHTASPPCNV